jgi:hypothetical protein
MDIFIVLDDLVYLKKKMMDEQNKRTPTRKSVPTWTHHLSRFRNEQTHISPTRDTTPHPNAAGST